MGKKQYVFEDRGYRQKKKLKKQKTKDVTEGTLPVHWDFIALYYNN